MVDNFANIDFILCGIYVFFLLSDVSRLVLTRVNRGGVDVKNIYRFVRIVAKTSIKSYLCTRYVIYSLMQGDDKSFFVQ